MLMAVWPSVEQVKCVPRTGVSDSQKLSRPERGEPQWKDTDYLLRIAGHPTAGGKS